MRRQRNEQQKRRWEKIRASAVLWKALEVIKKNEENQRPLKL